MLARLRATQAQKIAGILIGLKPLFALRTLPLVVILAQRAVIFGDIAFVIVDRKGRAQKLVSDRARKGEERAAVVTTCLLGIGLDFVSALTAMHECHRAIFLPRRAPLNRI